jgi:hypothetical protein
MTTKHTSNCRLAWKNDLLPKRLVALAVMLQMLAPCDAFQLLMPSPTLPEILSQPAVTLSQSGIALSQSIDIVSSGNTHNSAWSNRDVLMVAVANHQLNELKSAERPSDGLVSETMPNDWHPSTATTLTVSLQEKKIPTAEEIAAKKRNFNLVFWGGGIVAPFIATIYFFGFKFWEK